MHMHVGYFALVDKELACVIQVKSVMQTKSFRMMYDVTRIDIVTYVEKQEFWTLLSLCKRTLFMQVNFLLKYD